MRRFSAFILALAFVAIAPGSPAPGWVAQASPPDVGGSWKLVVLPASEIEFAVVVLKPAEGGKLAADLAAVNEKLIGPYDSAGANVSGDQIAVRLIGANPSITFRGTIEADGQKALGTIRSPGGFHRARLERTSANTVAPPSTNPTPLYKELSAAQSIVDVKERVGKVLELLAANPGNPINPLAYTQVLVQADAIPMSTEAVGKIVGRWLDEAKPYGPGWVGETQAQILKTLQGKKAYAGLAIEVGQAAEKALPTDASTEQRAAIATLLADSAALAGNEAVAAEASTRVREYDTKLDAEFAARVPPFKIKPYSGRPGGKGTRVVLMEVFTGAECPPCIAPDVAFDGLLRAFKPTEFIGLQYHEHIPGPDPLTNPDNVARAENDYTGEIQSTPAVFINGSKFAVPGGSMGEAEMRYIQFRRLIEPDLTERKLAEIDLKASRVNDVVTIEAKAKVDLGPRRARPRLRVVLIEKTVRYPGGNKLRLHHNVVRIFPGGVHGKAVDDEAIIKSSIPLGELRSAQDAYLKALATAAANSGSGKGFSNPMPAYELDDLAVVAFVQNDVDRTIWDARQVDLDPATP